MAELKTLCESNKYKQFFEVWNLFFKSENRTRCCIQFVINFRLEHEVVKLHVAGVVYPDWLE